MLVRALEERDISAIKEIIKEGHPYLGPNGYYIYWMAANLYKGYSFVAEEEGNVCGFVTALPNPDEKAMFVWQLGVAKNMRKKLVAYQLLSAVWNHGSEKGYLGIITSINANNQASQNSFKKVAREHGLEWKIIGKFEADGFEEDLYKFS